MLHEDEEKLSKFYQQATWSRGCDTASPVSKEKSTEVDRDHLVKTCFADFDRSIVLVVEGEVNGEKAIIAAGRVNKVHMSEDMTCALQVLPQFAKKGLGKLLAQDLIAVAKAEGAAKVRANIHSSNAAALNFVKSLKFSVSKTSDPELLQASLELKAKAKL